MSFNINKKGQSQIISTVLIILLVLAAIIILWQVVGGTVRKGADEIEQQSACLSLRLDITNVDTTANTVTIRPTSDISAYRAYVEGVEFGVLGGSLAALDTVTISGSGNISVGDEVEVLGKIGDAWCPGTKQAVS